MPKGRGSNKRRWSGRQWRPKDKEAALTGGYYKLQLLGRRAELVVANRRSSSPVAKAVATKRLAAGKAKEQRRAARAKWAR
jgi:hypothetical protein